MVKSYSSSDSSAEEEDSHHRQQHQQQERRIGSGSGSGIGDFRRQEEQQLHRHQDIGDEPLKYRPKEQQQQQHQHQKEGIVQEDDLSSSDEEGGEENSKKKFDITDPDHHFDVYHESDSESLQIVHSPRLPSDRFIEFDESPRDPSPEDIEHKESAEDVPAEVEENETPRTEDEGNDNDEHVAAIEEAFIEVPMTGSIQPPILLSDDDEMEIGSPPPTERDEIEKERYYGYEQAIHEMGESQEHGFGYGGMDEEQRPPLDRDYTQKSVAGGDGEGNDDWAKRNQGARGKVSDLISRFNQGGEGGAAKGGIKQDYGSGRQIGKIQQTKFR